MTPNYLHEDLQSTLTREIELATLNVFASMVGANLLPEASDSVPAASNQCNIVSTVDLSGPIQGIAQVGYTLPLATYITCRMLEIEPPAKAADVLDTAAEVANMIIGSMKGTLEGKLGRIRIGIPAVEIYAALRPFSPLLSVNFRCLEEAFTVSVTLQPA